MARNAPARGSAARNIPMIGLSADELPWVRTLVSLLRNPDPTVPELARQALVYLAQAAENAAAFRHTTAERPKNASMVNCME